MGRKNKFQKQLQNEWRTLQPWQFLNIYFHLKGDMATSLKHRVIQVYVQVKGNTL